MASVDLGKVTDLLETRNQIWQDPTGTIMNANQTVRELKNINSCKTGWLLVWRSYNAGIKDWGYSVTPIYKWSRYGGKNSFHPVPVEYNGKRTMCVKQLYVGDTYITGHDQNSVDEASATVLWEIVEF